MTNTPTPAPTTDVVIIGGGLAGLSAADALRNSGLSVTLLEAGTRLGGRTFGEYWPPADRMIDMGGTWLLPSFERTFKLLAELGLETVESPDSDLWLTHFRGAPETRRHLNASERAQLELAISQLGSIIDSAPAPLNAAAALAAARERPEAPTSLIEDWQVAMQRYLAGAPLDTVDAGHLLLDVDDIADPEHYHTQIAGTTQTLVNALSRRITARVLLEHPVSRVERKGQGFRVTTIQGAIMSARHVIVAAPLNCLSTIAFDDNLLGTYAPLIEAGHVGAARKDWLVLDGVPEHFRVFGSHGPYGYLRSEAILTDGGMLCVGLTPSAEATLETAELERRLRELYLPHARVRARVSHNWNTDQTARGTWFVPRPGQYEALPTLRTAHPSLHIVGSDVDAAFPGMLEGAVLSGQRAAAAIHPQTES